MRRLREYGSYAIGFASLFLLWHVAAVYLVQSALFPPPGSVITRPYKGETLRVKVLDGSAFEFEGEVFQSLSAVAKKVTGGHCNGFAFFKLGKEAV